MKTNKIKNDKGFILVLTLVTMVSMTVIGISLVMNMNVDTQLSRNEREGKQAFQLADAGIQEAISRLHLATANTRYIGELTTDANYRATGWNAANALGKDFGVGVGGDRNSVDNLNYTVNIEYLSEDNSEGFCDTNDDGPNTSTPGPSTYAAVPTAGVCLYSPYELVMYGQDFNIDSTVTNIIRGKQPVYKISSTSTVNNTTRTIEAYIGASSLNTDTEFGLNTNACIDVSGSATTIGVVKQGTDPITGLPCGCDPKIPAAGGSCAPNKTSADVMNTYLGPPIADVITFADEKHQCLGATCNAPGDDIPTSGKIDGVVTDWGDLAGNTYSTFIYIDNGGGNQVEISGNFTGRGILIVTGDLKLSGGFQYEGLIYVFGTLTVSGGGGSLNVLGGVMANNAIGVSGSISVTYDQATLEAVAKESSSSAILVWKRL